MSNKISEHLARALDVMGGQQARLAKAARYYNGETDEVFASAKFRNALRRTGADFKINFCHVVVSAVLNRLTILGINTADETAETVLDQVWDANDLAFESNEIHRSALVYGDTYLMVWLDDDDGIVVTHEPPTQMHLFYEQENPRRKSYGIKLWQASKDLQRANLYYSDRIEKYEGSKESWELLSTEENPFGVIPIFHFRTQRPYGRPEHLDAYGPQDMINKIVITQMATTDYHGFPQRYALSDASDLSNSSDFDDFSEDSSSSQQTAPLKAGPGEVWYLQGVSQVGQFEAANADVFLKPFETYVKSLAAVTETPIHMFEGYHGTISGESIRAAEAPLTKKVMARQFSFGRTWEEVFAFIVSLMGFETEAPEVVWQPSETIDTKESWEAATLKKALGVPLEMILTEQGYDLRKVIAVLQNTSLFNVVDADPDELRALAQPDISVELPPTGSEA